MVRFCARFYRFRFRSWVMVGLGLEELGLEEGPSLGVYTILFCTWWQLS